jgi:hypothetical protein
LYYANINVTKAPEQTGAVMLPAELERQFNDFYHTAYADGEVEGKTKVLIGMAVSMAVGCYP